MATAGEHRVEVHARAEHLGPALVAERVIDGDLDQPMRGELLQHLAGLGERERVVVPAGGPEEAIEGVVGQPGGVPDGLPDAAEGAGAGHQQPAATGPAERRERLGAEAVRQRG